jgi:dUTP pyrophosphatase
MQSKIEVRLVDTRLPEKCNHEILPNYATVGSAGLDLRSGEGYILKAGESHSFHTGIAVFLNDPSICGLLVPRSSLGIKKIHLTNTLGIIDADYQGELIIPLTNNSTEPFHVEVGQRIAQLVVIPVVHVHWQPVLDFSVNTARSVGGFGSTGEK